MEEQNGAIAYTEEESKGTGENEWVSWSRRAHRQVERWKLHGPRFRVRLLTVVSGEGQHFPPL